MTKLKVLPIDDNPGILKQIVDCLSQKPDIEITGCAYDGASALQLIDQTSPDVILLDIVMPKMDGFAVLEALAQRGDKSPRAIIITSLARDDFIDRAMRLGASYYMIKPLDMQILYNRILETFGEGNTASPPIPLPSPVAMQHSADEQVTNLFLTIGIPAHIKGYQYLREAVHMVLENHDVINRITKELYPGIARRFATSSLS